MIALKNITCLIENIHKVHLIITFILLPFVKTVLDYFTGCGEFMNKTFVQQFKSLFLPNPEYFATKCITASMYTMGGYNAEQIHWVQIIHKRKRFCKINVLIFFFLSLIYPL